MTHQLTRVSTPERPRFFKSPPVPEPAKATVTPSVEVPMQVRGNRQVPEEHQRHLRRDVVCIVVSSAGSFLNTCPVKDRTHK